MTQRLNEIFNMNISIIINITLYRFHIVLNTTYSIKLYYLIDPKLLALH